MGHTIAEKILAAKADRPVEPGEILQIEYDFAATNDGSTPGTKAVLNQDYGFDDHDFEIADPDRLAIVPDHYVPAHTEHAQRAYAICKEVAERHEIKHFYPQTEQGLMHVVVPEDGLVKPGDVYIGADSHSVTPGAIGVFATGISYMDMAFAWLTGWTWLRVPDTVRIEYTGTPSPWVRGKDLILETIGRIGVDGAVYKAMEFGGEPVATLPMDDRFSMTNMTIEAGGKTGFVDPDDTTRAYVDERVDDDYTLYEPDPDATYDEQVTIDCDGMELRIAAPHNPGNVDEVSAFAGTPIDQAVVGSCTNCRVEDLRQAADLLDGHRVHPDVRLIITPGSQRVQTVAYDEGWMRIFHDAGATMGSPGCGACFGEHIGALTENEVCIATTNRNFIGRMGPESSDVYLANPSVATASAITGEITHPGEVA